MNNHAEIVEKYRDQITPIVKEGWKLTEAVTKLSFDTKAYVGHWQLHAADGTLAAEFHLQQLPGCCGVCVSTGAQVHHSYQKKGLGVLLNSLRIDMARELGFGVLLCTDKMTNKPQRKILAANGWKDVHKFINPRTGNTIAISLINL